MTPFLSAALVGRSDRSRAAFALIFGLAGLVWGATSLDTGAGLTAFLKGGPLGGLSIWSRTAGDDGPGGEPPDDPEPPQWEWERFERDLGEYEADRLVGSRSSSWDDAADAAVADPLTVTPIPFVSREE